MEHTATKILVVDIYGKSIENLYLMMIDDHWWFTTTFEHMVG